MGQGYNISLKIQIKNWMIRTTFMAERVLHCPHAHEYEPSKNNRLQNSQLSFVYMYNILKIFPSKDMQPPLLQFFSHFNGRCAMCWIEWKINFPIFTFLSYSRFCLQFSIVFTLITIKIFTKKIFKTFHIYMKDAQWAVTNKK